MTELDRYSKHKVIYTNVSQSTEELDKTMAKIKKWIKKRSQCRRGEICFDVNICFDKP